MPVKKIKKAKSPAHSAKKQKAKAKLAKKPIKKIATKKAIKKPQKIKQKKLPKKPKKSTIKLKNKKQKNIKNNKPKILERIISPKEKKPSDKKNENNNNSKKSSDNKFKAGEHAIYPSHGVGQITEIEKAVVLGQDFSCYLMYFEREKLTIKIPINSAHKIGLRHLVSKTQMDEVFNILRSGVKKLKGMWSRRAQEYETKINSGDIILLAEVLRDLTRDIEDGERSYSERIIYETAIHRLASEYAVIYNVSFEEAREKVVIAAKDKLNSEGKITQKDEFDEFDYDGQDSENDENEENEDEEEEDEDEDEDEDYEDDDEEDVKPKKRARR